MKTFHRVLGMFGAYAPTDTTLRKVSHFFNKARLLLVLLLALQWHWEFDHQLTPLQTYLINSLIWAWLALETAWCWVLVPNRMVYCQQNWGMFALLIMGIPLLFHYAPMEQFARQYRIVFILWLALPWIDNCVDNFSDNSLKSTIWSALFIVLFAGIVMSTLDPGIRNLGDGIWWAWVTISTLGYGDIVPISTAGRLFASLLILIGLALFSVLTANFSAIFIHRNVRDSVEAVKKESEDIRRVLLTLRRIEMEESDIIAKLSHMEDKIQRLEDKLSNPSQRSDSEDSDKA